ncbi:glycosyl transferase family 2 [Candidatus Thiomargarita nelsonii]|uniref:Glycosyl transferase family 2 n=1 Tax=Candidatus Thiomargarita nelsonii TaxID=1003181 RepID=A0A0A6PE67_9GAMM|nr:glycosyl transferase family 2 [Candidatus Thiomargarita nelsonii]
MPVDRVISVIIVNFNAGPILTDCVHSVFASTVPVTVYVVDNASQDDSLSVMDNRVHILKNRENMGFASAANLVLPLVNSEYLLFLNPDCLVRPDTLARFVNVMDSHPQAGMAGCLVRNVDGSEQAACRRAVPTPWRTLVRICHLDKLFPNYCQNFELHRQPLPKHPIEIEGISGACMFVRRSALDRVGPMDEAYFLHCEDLDWFMRFRAHQLKILFIPDVEVVHVKGVCSHSQPIRVLWYKHRGMVRFYRKFFRDEYPFLLFWGVIVAVWLRFFLSVISYPLSVIKRRFSS